MGKTMNDVDQQVGNNNSGRVLGRFTPFKRPAAFIGLDILRLGALCKALAIGASYPLTAL